MNDSLSGKGDFPRPYNRVLYEKNYERIFGHKCTACKGKGYHVDWNEGQKKPFKTTCLLCEGTGYVK